MAVRLKRVLPPATIALLSLLGATGYLPAQQPTPAKAAPRQLVVSTASPAARLALEAALLELENASFVRANPHLRRALELDPGGGVMRSLYAAFAAGLSREERVREADRAVIDAARATTPELLTAMYMRAWVHADPAATEALVRALRALVPDDPFAATMQMGMALMGGQPKDVVGMGRDFLARNPDAPPVYNLLGYGLYRSGQRAEGLQTMKRYTELLPDHPNSHDSYAELLQQEGRLDEAEAEYRRALQLYPAFTNSYRGLARTLQRRHDYRAARTPLEAAVVHAQDAEERADGQRDVAFNAVFLGDMAAARKALAAAAREAEQAGLAEHAAFSHGFLAILEAAQGSSELVKRHLTLRAAAPAWNRAVGSALVHGAQGKAAEVAKDLAALQQAVMDAPRPSPDALPLVRLIERALNRDLAGARSELGALKAANYRLLGQAFVLRLARRSKDVETVKAMQTEMAQYTTVDANSAFSHRLVGLP